MERVLLSFKDLDLYIDMIYSLIPSRRVMLIRYHPYYASISDKQNIIPKGCLIPVTVDDEKEFNKIKFEYIKHIKKAKNPEDRVADFEYMDTRMIPDFEKMDRLIEKRKTREEKAQELKEEIDIFQLCTKNRIEYFGSLRNT